MKRNPAHPPLKRGPLVLLTDGILLVLALYGTVFSFSSAFALQIDRAVVLAACVLFAGLSLAIFSLPKLCWLPLLAAAALYLFWLRQSWELLVLGEISLRCSLVNTFAQALGIFQEISPIAQLPEEVWIQATTRLICAAAAVLSVVMGLSVVRLRSFWLLFWDSFPFAAIPLIILITPDWLPLMALLLVWCVMLTASLTGKANPTAGVRVSLAAIPACAALLALLLAVIPQKGYQRPAWADTANERITNWAVHLSDQIVSDLGSGGALASADGGIDLSRSGPLHYSGRTVLRVSTNLRGRIYLRGFSGGVYQDNSWQPLDETAYEGLDELSGSLEGNWQPMNFPALAERSTFPEKDFAAVTVENLGAASGYVFYPYQLLTTPEQLNGAEFAHDAWVGRASSVWTHTVYVMPDCDPLGGAQLTGEAALAEQQYGLFVWNWPYYIDIPEEIYYTILRCVDDMLAYPEQFLPNGRDNEHYAALLSGAGMTSLDEREAQMEIVGMVTDYLAQLAEYNPDTPVTPEGEDFVVYFLTESHEGYCMHFASAAALLLRCFGIPTRYVSGYVADIPASGTADVPDSNAHAWVEVYVRGYGWEPVEVTPVYAGGHPGQSGDAAPTPTPSTAPAPTPVQTSAPHPTPTTAPAPTPQLDETEDASASDFRLLRLPGGILLALAGLVLRRKLAQIQRMRRFTGQDPNRAAIDAYLYLQRLERWGGYILPVAEDLAQKAKFSQHTLTEEELAQIRTAALDEGARVDDMLPMEKRLVFRYLFGLY